MADVFISYHLNDTAVARQLCEKLRQRNISVWYAEKDVEPGRLISRAVMDAMRQSGIFVFVLSKSSVCSDFFLNELQYAKILLREERKDIRLFPLVIDKEGKSALSARIFQGIPWFDSTSPLSDDTLNQLAGAIQEQLSKPDESAFSKKPHSVRTERRLTYEP